MVWNDGELDYGRFGYDSGMMFSFSLRALVSGILVIVGAIILNARPKNTAWSIIVLVFSIVSFMGMGGFFIGVVLGIAGGALALSLRPSQA